MSLPSVHTAGNVGPDPGAPVADVTADTRAAKLARRSAAYRACRAHPAYRDVRTINDRLKELIALCQKFAAEYDPNTIRDHLRALGLARRGTCDDFACLYTDISNAPWYLDMLRCGIEPALLLPLEDAEPEGGAA